MNQIAELKAYIGYWRRKYENAMRDMEATKAALREEIDANANYTAHVDELEQENARLREEKENWRQKWFWLMREKANAEEVKG